MRQSIKDSVPAYGLVLVEKEIEISGQKLDNVDNQFEINDLLKANIHALSLAQHSKKLMDQERINALDRQRGLTIRLNDAVTQVSLLALGKEIDELNECKFVKDLLYRILDRRLAATKMHVVDPTINKKEK